MKKINFLISTVLLTCAVVVVVSCGGSSKKSESTAKASTEISSSEEQLFGNIPDINAKYCKKIEELKEKIKQNKDIERAFKLGKGLQELEEEADNAVGDYIKDLEKPMTVPVIQEGYTDEYKVNEMTVTEGRLKRVKLMANVEILKDPFTISSVYIQMFRGDDPDTDWLILGVTGKKKAGETHAFYGSLDPKKLAGVTKLVAKTKEDFQESMKTKVNK